MTEKILIKSEQCNIISIATKFLASFLLLCVLISLIPFMNEYSKENKKYKVEVEYDVWYTDYYHECKHYEPIFNEKYIDLEAAYRDVYATNHKNLASYIVCSEEHSFFEFCPATKVTATVCLILFCVVALTTVLMFLWFSSCSLTVTDKRIYGKSAFGERVDLPIDKISAIGTSVLLKGIFVGTSSGKIKFVLIKNQQEIHDIVSKLLMDRQNKTRTEESNIHMQSNADELQKYKNLLDSGAITQEEFDAKKKQLLGL